MSSVAAAQRTVTVALCGRPNAGKTSLVMRLTGASLRPINFPGTSVERIEAETRAGDVRLRVVDLPGVQSLVAASRDEGESVAFLRGRDGPAPDLLCAVLDASKLSVELHLLAQLRRLGLPIVVALTKQDVAVAQGQPVDQDALRRALGLPLVAVDNRTGAGVDELRALLASAQPSSSQSPPAAAADPHATAAAVTKPASPRRTWTDRLDAVLLHRLLGPLLLAAVVVLLFQVVFTAAEPFVAGIETGQEWLGDRLGGLFAPGATRSFVVDGLVNGLGSVLVFVPQIALLIALVTLLESTGYMARAVFLLDRVLRKVGLTGRSFVPLTSSFACAIPGILAARIIDDERDRLATIAVAPLMSCSARLPVYVVMIGAFFPPAQAGLVLFGLYLLGIVAAALVAFLLRKTVLKGGRSMLAMELPVYQPPAWKVIGLQVWLAVRGFLKAAGSVIFVATVVVWALAYYPRPPAVAAAFAAERAAVATAPEPEREELLAGIDAREQAAWLEQSWLARLGKAVQPAFAPAGFDWRLTVGILASFPARELIVPTLGTLHSLGEVDAGAFDLGALQPEDRDEGLRGALRRSRGADGRPTMDGLIALGLMAFFALCSQCVSTLGVIRRETHGWRWPVFSFVYMTVLAWLVAVAIHQIGRLLGFGLPG